MSSPEEYYRETLLRSFRVKRSDIWYLHFIFEAYDGVATVSTADSREGLVALRIPRSRADDADLLLRSLAGEIELEEVFR